MITDHLAELVRSALARAQADGVVEERELGIGLERPKRREHGDWATNVALEAAAGKGNPRAVAQELLDRIPPSEFVARVEVAGPGFLNFHLSPVWLHDVVRSASRPGSGFGRSELYKGARINVEYVSANPTGPINVVSGRHAAVGDAIANLFAAMGAEVTREFFINDAGRQMELFAESVAVRYLQHHGRDTELPDDGYKGAYLTDLAKEIAGDVGDRYVDAEPKERSRALGDIALERMLAQMRASLERFGTTYDVWFSERTLHDSGAVEASVNRLKQTGTVEERDGATWFKSSELGDDKDRVLVRADGRPTYLASDVAYLLNKVERGSDHLLYLWGADHHGTIARLLAVAEALGIDRDRVEIRIVQVVTLLEGGQSLKGSKRAGIVYPLDELIDEVGVDAARYTFLTRSIDAPLDFDVALAKEQAPENPVYYVQYAHARISSILRRASEIGISADAVAAPLELLVHPSEDELMRKLATYEETLIEAAGFRAPQRVTRYLEELASTFSAFYRDCKVVSDDDALTRARLTLCTAAKNVIADGLGLLSVAAPERM